MSHRSLRRTLEAIVTPAIAVMIALAGADFSAPGRSRRNEQKTPNSRAATTSLSHGRAVAAFSPARWQHGPFAGLEQFGRFNSITDIRRRIDHRQRRSKWLPPQHSDLRDRSSFRRRT